MKSKKPNPKKQKSLNWKEETFRNSLILREKSRIFCSDIHI